jgi:hypothetical protein
MRIYVIFWAWKIPSKTEIDSMRMRNLTPHFFETDMGNIYKEIVISIVFLRKF